MSDDWEISFNLQAAERSESFHFTVNSLRSSDKPFPNFPKEKFLRALKSHSIDNKYVLYSGRLTSLKFKNTLEYNENQEFHIIMLVFENIGPVSLIFRHSFSYLTLEAIDSHYNYIGHEALMNVLIQIIKPDSPTIKGLGRIKTIYYASNEKEIAKKENSVSLLDSVEGQVFIFSLSIILPTIVIIALPLNFLDSMLGYFFSLALLAVLWSSFPIIKRSVRHAPLSFISVLLTYLILEILIHFNFLIGGINPWGIFNNISRQNLIGILQNQSLIVDLGREFGFGLELLQIIIPFFDIIIIGFIPFTIAVGSAGLIEKFDINFGKRIFLRVFFLALLITSLIAIPLSYHMLGKGTEGTLHASIGLIETSEMFTSKFIENLNDISIQVELMQLISSAREHLLKANNSFEQFAQNPLIVYVLPYFIPEVAGIPLVDLPDILALTSVLAETLPYYPNILWAINNLQTGFNQTFEILLNSIGNISQGGFGSSVYQEYDVNMKEALYIMNLGVNNLTIAESPLKNLIDQIEEKLNYSVFAEISNLLTTIDVSLPILINVVSNSIPWINSTYKLALALNELYNFNFVPDILSNAKIDFSTSEGINNINTEDLPADTLIPINELVTFSQNLYEVTKYLLFSVENASYMLQELNGTLSKFQEIKFDNSSNIHDPIWVSINLGLENTSRYLNSTKVSINQMREIIKSQEIIEFEGLAELNIFLDNLDSFTQDASDRFDVIDSYFSALNNSYWAINYFSKGSYSLNGSITETIETLSTIPSFNANEAVSNFTLCQITANITDDLLLGISDHLLNESAINNWRDLIKGDIQTNDTNSIYMNAKICLDLIKQIEIDILSVMTLYNDFLLILIRMDQIEWNIFASVII